jgi:hypothetical protein
MSDCRLGRTPRLFFDRIRVCDSSGLGGSARHRDAALDTHRGVGRNLMVRKWGYRRSASRHWRLYIYFYRVFIFNVVSAQLRWAEGRSLIGASPWCFVALTVVLGFSTLCLQ